MKHDYVLLDRSYSMLNQWGEALAGVNAYVRKLAEDKVDTGVTLVTFDTNHDGTMSFDIIRDRIIPSTWRPVGAHEVSPRGGTPLNDATARMVNIAENAGYDNVAFIIMTDGEENASREHAGAEGLARVRGMLDRIRAKGWQVIFLGADFNNQKQAASYNNTRGSTISATVGTFATTLENTAMLRSAYAATGQAMNYTAGMRQQAGEKVDNDLTKADTTTTS